MKFLFVIFILSVFYLSPFAQKPILLEGNISSLKGIKKIRLVYDYSNMIVGKMKEVDYVNNKVSEYNEKQAGKGDAWKENWIGNRTRIYQPAFQEFLNNYLIPVRLEIWTNITNTKYYCIVKTTYTEPGFYVIAKHKPAKIIMDVSFVEENTNIVVAKIQISAKSKSSASYIGTTDLVDGFDERIRIKEAYSQCGKKLAKFILKNIK